MTTDRETARRALLAELRGYGLEWDAARRQFKVGDGGWRAVWRALAAGTNQAGLKYATAARGALASPREVAIERVDPYLVEVGDAATRRLWAYAVTQWSLPVSEGYGRRLRFLVFDRQNNKLIGLFGLGDPLIGHRLRDRLIGWSAEQKRERLYHCLTAYVLGAVEPYTRLLGAKLVALAAQFPEVRARFRAKYGARPTILGGRARRPELALIETFGAFGRSAIYTRLFNWRFGGYTQGATHLHLTTNKCWELLKSVVDDESFRTYGYGQGTNWKLRTVRIALKRLELDGAMLRTRARRAYYLCPLMANWRAFLQGATDEAQYYDYSREFLLEVWRRRWVEPRRARLEAKLRATHEEK